MTEYAVQSGHLAAAIHVGRLNDAGTAFTDKQDRTDMTLAAVGSYVRDHFDGGMVADFPGMGFVLEVKVRPIDQQPLPDEATTLTAAESDALTSALVRDAARGGDSETFAVTAQIKAEAYAAGRAAERDRSRTRGWAQTFLDAWVRPYFGVDQQDAVAAVQRAAVAATQEAPA